MRKTKFIKTVSVVLILIIVSTFALTSCKKEEDTFDNKLFTYYLEKSPQIIDPQVAIDTPSLVVIQNTFEGLCKLNKDGELVSGVAKSFTSNDDFTKFTFSLRTDAKWSDGTSVTSYDFLYGFKRILDPATSSSTSSALYCIKNAKAIRDGEADMNTLGVTAVDRYTLIIELEYSYEKFPYETVNAQYMPCNEVFFTQSRGKYGMSSESTLANGGFMLRENYGWDKNSYIRLVRNEEYKGENEVVPSGVYFKFGSSIDNAIPLLTDDEKPIDLTKIYNVDTNKAKEEGINLKGYSDTTWGIAFNCNSGVFANANLRRAFVTAIERKELIGTVNNDDYSFYKNIIPIDLSLYSTNYRQNQGDVTLPVYDIQKAKSLYSLALEEIELKALPQITILCPDDFNSKLMANSMVAQLREAFGFYSSILPLEEKELMSRVEMGNYQIAITNFSVNSSSPLDCLYNFTDESSNNFTNYNDETFEEILYQAKTNLSTSVFSTIKQAEQYLIDNAVFYPLYSDSTYYALNSNVEDLIIYPFSGIIDFFYAGKFELEN